MSDSSADTFRWQAFFQHAGQPVFLLNRRRQILFTNRAWEACTGLKFLDIRGRSCRRRAAATKLDRAEAVLAALAPPIEAVHGQTRQCRRRVPGSADWWEIQFIPLAGPENLLGILGIIRVLPAPAAPAFTLPPKLVALRDRLMSLYQLTDSAEDTPAVARMHAQARLAANMDVPISIVGESGTGKEWLARAIHHLSARRQHAFACLDAERIPAELLNDILFGSRSRNVALGTVLLHSPDSLPRETQARLAEILQATETTEFPRIIVAHRREPRAEIQAGRLLAEFHYASSALTIEVPPLRERLNELERFIDGFLQRAGELQPHAVAGVSREAINTLRGYSWPGNLSELQQVLNAACRRAQAERIEIADLPFYLKQGKLPAERRLPLDTLLEQVERRLIALAMRLTQDNQTRAAELLEIWRPRLLRRLEKFGGTETAPGSEA